ncbi:Curved DNA-binding protein [Apiospora arundinis]|uniref:Uncharacterized protein n=1 Tax=Apiospora arundinis TaxID=335852 RepID=A0ABR2IR41_9PEZI
MDYYVKVVRRLYVWRHARDSTEDQEKRLRKGDFRSRQTADFLVAEKLGPRQRWWVDGYVFRNLEPDVPKRQEPPDATSWTSPENRGQSTSILNAFFNRGHPRPVRPAEPVKGQRTNTSAPPPVSAKRWLLRTFTK